MLRLPPRNVQILGREKLQRRPLRWGQDCFAWLQEMGLGKTYSVLWDWVESGIPDLLVIAPAGSYRNWWDTRPGVTSELDKFLLPELRERMLVQGYWAGMGVNARRRVGAFLEERERPRALFVNVEALSSTERARELVASFVGPGCMTVIDESTRIRTPDSKRTDWIVRVSKAARARRIMTGFPTPKGPLNLFSQFEFLDWRILGFNSYWAFRMRYAVMKQISVGVMGDPRTGVIRERKAWIDVAYRNEEELQQAMEPYSFRALKRDHMSLGKLYQTREVELTDEQVRAYREMETQAFTELKDGEIVTAKMRMTLVMRLHQIVCGHAHAMTGEVVDLKSRRMDALMEVLEETSGKAVIWCAYADDVRLIGAALGKEYGPLAVARFWGGNAGTRHNDEARWKGDAACRWMVATEGAGGVGNNWTAAGTAIYYSNSYDLEHRVQSEDRIHRDGQTRTCCTYVDLVVPGSVDERIIDVLSRKLDMAARVMGEDFREWVSLK
jgi:hypothetical protein